MKTITAGCAVHEFSMTLVNIIQTSEKSCVYRANSENNQISFWICIDIYISRRFPV